MSPRESVIAVLVPAWQRIHMRAVAREIAIVLRAHFDAEGARALEARLDALEGRR